METYYRRRQRENLYHNWKVFELNSFEWCTVEHIEWWTLACVCVHVYYEEEEKKMNYRIERENESMSV